MDSLNKGTKGYKVLEVHYGSSKEKLLLYVKRHTSRGDAGRLEPNRTLFIINVPPYMDKMSIASLFKHYGNVQEVLICNKPLSNPTEPPDSHFQHNTLRSHCISYVVFEVEGDVDKVLQTKSALKLESEDRPLSGVTKWCRNWNNLYVDTKILSKECEEFISKFDNLTAQNAEAAKSLAEPDEEGWTTVTKGGRRPGLARTENVEGKVKEIAQIKSRKRELLNFYTFQIREKKMKHIEELRKKFDEDKAKLALIKQRRKFKPF